MIKTKKSILNKTARGIIVISGENGKQKKIFFGNDKVNTDIFGNPKIETDWLGNQKIETDWLGNPYVEPEKKDDSGCYLSTTCMQVMADSFDDNCIELDLLRNFRDSYVKEHHPEAIEEYYKIAPKIVSTISSNKNSKKIYREIYSDFILKTIELIQDQQFEKVYNQYKNYSLKLIEDLC